MPEKPVVIFCDGASRGNPGPAAFGVAAFVRGKESTLSTFRSGEDATVFKLAQKIGRGTNNEAEYRAIIAALTACEQLGITEPTLASDSELVIRQLQGQYKVKNENLKTLYTQAAALVARVRPKLMHVPREKNQIADHLANLALDTEGNAPLFTNG